MEMVSKRLWLPWPTCENVLKDMTFVVVNKRDLDSVNGVAALVTAVDPKRERLPSFTDEREELLPPRETDAAACPLNAIQLVSTCSLRLSQICQLTSALSVAR
jgi:hypothetical protein